MLTDNAEKRRLISDCVINVTQNLDIIPSNILLSTIEQELKDTHYRLTTDVPENELEVAKKLFEKLKVYGKGRQVKGALVTAFDVELLFLAKKAGYKIKMNIPVLTLRSSSLPPVAGTRLRRAP